MNTHKRTRYLLLIALLVAGCLTISPYRAVAASSASGSEEVSGLLADVKTEAHELQRDVEDIKMFTLSTVSWQSHAGKLEEVKRHVNHAGQLLTKLNEARSTASAWQEQAIDAITPLLQELAANTTAMIDHLNNNQDRHRFNTEYQDYAEANRDLATNLAALITDYVDYGKRQAEFERLQDKLQVAEK